MAGARVSVGLRVVSALVLPCVCLHSIAAPPRPVTGAPRMGLGTAHSQRSGRDGVEPYPEAARVAHSIRCRVIPK